MRASATALFRGGQQGTWLGTVWSLRPLHSSSEVGRPRLLTDGQPALGPTCCLKVSLRLARSVGGGPQPSDDAVAMAEAAPARVSAPAHGRRVRGSRPTRPRAPPTLGSRSHRPGGHVGHQSHLHMAAGGLNTRPGGLGPETSGRDMASVAPLGRALAFLRKAWKEPCR